MKICFLGDAITHHMRRWTKYFAEKGHDVHVLTFHEKYLSGYEPVKVQVIPKPIRNKSLLARILNAFLVWWRIKRAIAEINPDLIHSHDAGGYAWMAMLTGFHPLMVSAQGGDILVHSKASFVNRILTKLALRKADVIHCDGYGMRDEIMKLGIPENKIKIVCFGTDTKKFKVDQSKRAKTNGDITVVSTRRLDPIHNVETLVKAIPHVLRETPEVRFVIAGYGSDQEMLEALTKSLNVDYAVRFLGMVEEHEMINALQNADVYVATSLSESGIAASMAEAMACELPVINTDTGDVKLWIEDDRNGYCIRPRDVQTLTKRIVELVKDPQKRTAFGKINRQLIEERNNYYIEMQKIENIYNELTRGTHAGEAGAKA
jgi:L-malate glycosyltransferase